MVLFGVNVGLPGQSKIHHGVFLFLAEKQANRRVFVGQLHMAVIEIMGPAQGKWTVHLSKNAVARLGLAFSRVTSLKLERRSIFQKASGKSQWLRVGD